MDYDNYELYHYGVKGMKWGVRRAIGKQARSYARDYYAKNKLTEKTSDVDKRIKKTEAKLEKLSKKKRDLENRIMTLNTSMNKKINGLSEKDIKQGKFEVMTGKIAKVAAGLTLSAAAAYVGANSTTATLRYIIDYANPASIPGARIGPAVTITAEQLARMLGR